MPHVGNVRISSALKLYGDEKALYEAVNKHDERLKEAFSLSGKSKELIISDIFKHGDEFDIDAEYENLLCKNIKFVTWDEEGYPERLGKLTNKPYALYYEGDLPEDLKPAVSIIGARECSEYGTYIANAFGNALASKDINIISGMARGVDGISQRGALCAGGRTFAVLGSGVDVCYPKGNRRLYEEIKEKGGIISTFPPGTEPVKRNFVLRNSIVASLADLILVVEARERSGTFITVNMALEMGKEVYAVPGRLTDRLSDGCNYLIRQGAGIALSPEDVARELGIIFRGEHPESDALSDEKIGKMDTGKTKKDEGILKYLDVKPRSADEIHAMRLKKEPKATLPQTLSELVLLCIDGKAVQVGTGYFYKVLDRIKNDY